MIPPSFVTDAQPKLKLLKMVKEKILELDEEAITFKPSWERCLVLEVAVTKAISRSEEKNKHTFATLVICLYNLKTISLRVTNAAISHV